MPLVTRGLGAFNTGASTQVTSQPPFSGTPDPTDLHVTDILVPDLKVESVEELDS